MRIAKNCLVVFLLFVLSLTYGQNANAELGFSIIIESGTNTETADNEKLCSLSKVGNMSMDSICENLVKVGVSEMCIRKIRDEVVPIEVKYPDSSYYFTNDGELMYETVEQIPNGERIVIK